MHRMTGGVRWLPSRLVLLAAALVAAGCDTPADGGGNDAAASAGSDLGADLGRNNGDDMDRGGDGGGTANDGGAVTRYTDLVDPRIGTAGTKSINCFPGAVLPWGMVAASPDTTMSTGTPPTGTHASGYLSEDDLIQGFSHTRLQGTSTPDIGSVLLI